MDKIPKDFTSTKDTYFAALNMSIRSKRFHICKETQIRFKSSFKVQN